MIVASVIPLLRLIRGLGAFDYAVPEELTIQPGMVVRIPFRQKTVRGFVIGVQDKKRSRYKLESIIKIVSSETLLPPYGLDVLRAIQKDILAPLPLLFRTFLPHIPSKNDGQLPPLPPCSEDYRKLQLPKTSISPIQKLLTVTKPTLFVWHRHDERVIGYIKLLQKHIASGSVLCLFPNTESIIAFCRALPPDLAATAVVLTSALSEKQFFTAWTAIARGEKRIVLATRTGLLAPLQNLRCIIVDGEEQYGWKEEQNPRYDARRVAGLIAKAVGVPCIFSSPSPTLESLHCFLRSTIKTPLSLRRAFLLEDLHDGFQSKTSHVIGAALSRRLQSLPDGATAILFLNRRGFSSTMQCMNCQRVLQCAHCLLPLTLHVHRGVHTLRCHHCTHIEPMQLVCPHCKKMNIKPLGKGVERIQQEAAQRFPHISVRCVTYPMLNPLLWQRMKPDLVGVIDALTPLHMADFRALEHVWQFLDTLTAWTAHLRIPLIIQTFAVEHPIFGALAQNNPALFYNTELAERKKSGYPPFTQLIKILIKHSDNLDAQKEVNVLAKTLSAVNPSAPYPAHPSRQHGKYVWQLLLRVPPRASLARVLKNLPSNVVIDVDPESTL